MGLLFFPVDNLGGWNWERTEAEFLYMGCEKKGGPVQKKIELAVVMKIERRRLVLDVFQNGIRRSFSERNPPRKPCFYRIGQTKLVPDLYDIGRTKQGNPKVETIFFESLIIFVFFRHESPL